MGFKDLNWFDWGYELLEAAIIGATATLGVMLVDPKDFNLAAPSKLAMVAAGGALIAIVNKLRQSPLPPRT